VVGAVGVEFLALLKGMRHQGTLGWSDVSGLVRPLSRAPFPKPAQRGRLSQ